MKKVSVSLQEGIYSAVEQEAKSKGMTVSEVIRAYIGERFRLLPSSLVELPPWSPLPGYDSLRGTLKIPMSPEQPNPILTPLYLAMAATKALTCESCGQKISIHGALAGWCQRCKEPLPGLLPPKEFEENPLDKLFEGNSE